MPLSLPSTTDRRLPGSRVLPRTGPTRPGSRGMVTNASTWNHSLGCSIVIWEFPKIKGPMIDSKQCGVYCEDTQNRTRNRHMRLLSKNAWGGSSALLTSCMSRYDTNAAQLSELEAALPKATSSQLGESLETICDSPRCKIRKMHLHSQESRNLTRLQRIMSANWCNSGHAHAAGPDP